MRFQGHKGLCKKIPKSLLGVYQFYPKPRALNPWAQHLQGMLVLDLEGRVLKDHVEPCTLLKAALPKLRSTGVSPQSYEP